jgi:hypothetical protein
MVPRKAPDACGSRNDRFWNGVVARGGELLTWRLEAESAFVGSSLGKAQGKKKCGVTSSRLFGISIIMNCAKFKGSSVESSVPGRRPLRDKQAYPLLGGFLYQPRSEIDDIPRRRIDLLEQCLDVRAANWINVEAESSRVAEKLRILHRRIECLT